MTPEELDTWRSTADLDARAGVPVGKALNAACDEIESLQIMVDRTAAEGSDHINDMLRQLTEAKADRDRARDAAVALEQQLAEMDVAAVRAISAEAKAVRELEQEVARVRAYAERCARSGNHAYAKAGRELLAILDGGEH